ncbi:MAG: hypothetical protein N4A46_15215, partial [Schleiferiaceae bacterium]|nr:hypothetical protein [Schleiferiaceae bacterium]
MLQLDVCKSEIKQLEPWGEIPWQELRRVENEAGLTIRFFEYPTRKIDNSWREDHAFELINEVNNKSYFVVFHTEDYNALPLVPLVLPKKSLNQLKEHQQKISEIKSELNDTLDGYAKEYTHYLEERIKAVEDRLSFEMAQNNYTDAAEDHVKIMTAWCPKNAEAKLEKLLEKEGVVYLSEEAT